MLWADSDSYSVEEDPQNPKRDIHSPEMIFNEPEGHIEKFGLVQDEEPPDLPHNLRHFEDDDPGDYEFSEPDQEYINHDQYHISKDMDEKDVTNEFLEMRDEVKREFFQLDTLFQTKYHYFSSGEQIGYRECGDIENINAPKVLFIHGNNACSLTWEKIMKQFLETQNQNGEILQLHCIAACSRGFGYSSYEKESRRVKDYADDLLKFMHEVFECEEFYIVAHSIGGIIAMHMALEMKQDLRGLQLINTNPPWGWNFSLPKKVRGKEDLKTRKMIFNDVRFEIISKVSNDAYQQFIQFLGMKPKSAERSRRALLIMSRQRNFWEFEWQAYYRVDLPEEDIHAIRCPVQIIRGMSDVPCPLDEGVGLQCELINTQAELIAIPKCGHFPHLTHQTLIHDYIRAWVEKLEKENPRKKLEPREKEYNPLLDNKKAKEQLKKMDEERLYGKGSRSLRNVENTQDPLNLLTLSMFGPINAGESFINENTAEHLIKWEKAKQAKVQDLEYLDKSMFPLIGYQKQLVTEENYMSFVRKKQLEDKQTEEVTLKDLCDQASGVCQEWLYSLIGSNDLEPQKV